MWYQQQTLSRTFWLVALVFVFRAAAGLPLDGFASKDTREKLGKHFNGKAVKAPFRSLYNVMRAAAAANEHLRNSLSIPDDQDPAGVEKHGGLDIGLILREEDHHGDDVHYPGDGHHHDYDTTTTTLTTTTEQSGQQHEATDMNPKLEMGVMVHVSEVWMSMINDINDRLYRLAKNMGALTENQMLLGERLTEVERVIGIREALTSSQPSGQSAPPASEDDFNLDMVHDFLQEAENNIDSAKDLIEQDQDAMNARVSTGMPPSMAPNTLSTIAPSNPSTMAPHTPSTLAPNTPSTIAPHTPSTMAPNTPSTKAPHKPSTMAPHNPSTLGQQNQQTLAPNNPPTIAPHRPTLAPNTPSTIATQNQPTLETNNEPTMAPHNPSTLGQQNQQTLAPNNPPTMASHKPSTLAPNTPSTITTQNQPTLAINNQPTMAPHNQPTMAPHSPSTLGQQNQQTLAPNSPPTMAPHKPSTLVPNTPSTIATQNQPTLATNNQPTMAPHNQPTMAPHNPSTLGQQNQQTLAPNNPPTMAPHRPTLAPNTPSTIATQNQPTLATNNEPTMAPHNQPTMAPHHPSTLTPNPPLTMAPHNPSTMAPHINPVPTMAPRITSIQSQPETQPQPEIESPITDNTHTKPQQTASPPTKSETVPAVINTESPAAVGHRAVGLSGRYSFRGYNPFSGDRRNDLLSRLRVGLPHRQVSGRGPQPVLLRRRLPMERARIGQGRKKK